MELPVCFGDPPPETAMSDGAPRLLRLRIDRYEPPLRLLLAPGAYRVGSASDNEIVLSERTVSRHHARIEVEADGSARIIDLGSSNGTRRNAAAVLGQAALSAGDRIAFGLLEGELDTVAADDARAAADARVSASESPAAAEPAANPALATLVPGGVARFGLECLPELLSCLRQGEGVAALASKLAQALADCAGALEFRVLALDGVGPALLYADAEVEGGRLLELQQPDLRLELRLPDGPERGEAELLKLALELLRMARTRPLPAKPSAPPMPVLPAPLPTPEPRDPLMRSLYTQAARVADSDLAVLILGESGTGKELFASYLHQASPRRERPLLALNCAALPRDLLELELFGIEDGVATGVKARPGLFEQADGGTLLLDEIGDLALDAQAKLLRTIQERSVLRIGARSPRPASARLVCATNADLQQRVADGSFRLDLYHRIAAWSVRLPPLRERGADLAALALHFLEQAAAQRGVRPAGISERALGLLRAHDWPGNVRELETEMRRAALFLGDGDLLDSGLLGENLRGRAPAPAPGTSLEAQLAEAERGMIRRALDASGGSVERAASLLEVSRASLYRRVQALGIEPRPGSRK